MAGKFFDQWKVGERLQHDIRRTVTETDNLLFSTMTHNPQPLHLDVEAAKESGFGQILVNSTFTFSLLVGYPWETPRLALWWPTLASTRL